MAPMAGISAAARRIPNPAKNAPMRAPVLVPFTMSRPRISELAT